MNFYHSPGPVGGVTLGIIAACVALLMWTAVYVYFFVFFKRKERQRTKLRQQMRLAPPSPRKVMGKKAGEKKV